MKDIDDLFTSGKLFFYIETKVRNILLLRSDWVNGDASVINCALAQKHTDYS